MKKSKSEEYDNAIHKRKQDFFGGTSLCATWIPFRMVWKWIEVTCEDCLALRKK